MKLFIICSKAFYGEIGRIKDELEKRGIEVYLPHTYDHPEAEKEWYEKGREEHAKMKGIMFHKSREMIKKMDAVLCFNMTKKKIDNYIGGSTFLELYEAFMENKKIYLYHDIPKGLLYDEIDGFSPIILNEDLNLIK